ncbi:MAG: 3-deoxy-D-manno-octulosonic acid transferase [Lewinellaceae bacterium]|nr:3-deoxy-D-manno-octulosonic acid transferase [Lewinellaceae bacterium]
MIQQKIWLFLYTIAIHIGNVYIYVGRFFNQKLSQLYHGRRNTLNDVLNWSKFENCIWIHCASLGEFEQGRPIIENIKSRFPNEKIALSFFSPSGYEIQKNYPYADYIFYLPSDLPKHATFLFRTLKPKMLVLVKYEFWWNLIYKATSHKVPIFSISSIFRDDQYFFSKWAKPCQTLLRQFDMHFVQDTKSASILSQFGINQSIVCGDTRIDRVLERSKNVVIDQKITEWIDGSDKVIVFGSVWPEDLPIVNGIIERFASYKCIIAPHKIDTAHLTEIKRNLRSASIFLYSDQQYDGQICLVDNIGKLSSLYAVATFAYIGGGFGAGIHNTLEAAVYGIPLVYGPKYQKFEEAVYFINHGIAFSVKDASELTPILNILGTNQDFYHRCKIGTKDFFERNAGATKKIVQNLFAGDGVKAWEKSEQ